MRWSEPYRAVGMEFRYLYRDGECIGYMTATGVTPMDFMFLQGSRVYYLSTKDAEHFLAEPELMYMEILLS